MPGALGDEEYMEAAKTRDRLKVSDKVSVSLFAEHVGQPAQLCSALLAGSAAIPIITLKTHVRSLSAGPDADRGGGNWKDLGGLA